MSRNDEKVKDLYNYGRIHDSSRAVVQKFNILRMDRANKEYVFVEGSSDATFYKNTSISILTDQSAYIYADYDSDSKVDKGKKVVCSALESIRRNEDLRYELDKCVFIIDKDYEYYKNNRVFTITEGHSMECYFLEKENIKIIFSFFNLSEEDADTFWNLYIDFASRCYEFFALKGTITYMYSESGRSAVSISSPYKTRHDYREIFYFTFDGKTYSFDEDKFNEELELLRNTLKANKNFNLYYQRLYNDIKDNPQMIRGHDGFEFLKQYLLQIHGITIHDNLRELIPVISDLGVDLDIKQIMYDL